MSRPFVTALIDTYNQGCFVAEAIESVLGQDFPASEIEVFVVDDGSTDDTAQAVEKFQPRVRYLRKANGGQGSAFNAGIAESQGEIVAFLDGDDWWAPGKVSAVTDIFQRESAVGLVGHGITSIHSDGKQVELLPRESTRFRLNSAESARIFRMRRGFLGTSRMAYRRSVLKQIGNVPTELTFEADEYLFTLAGLYADVLILQQSLTFYRLHDKNLYQLSDGDGGGVRKKQQVIAALARALGTKFDEMGVSAEIANTILECVEVEADHLRLIIDGGYPWETVSTEMKIMRVFHSDASLWQHAFSYARLVPAFVMPADSYYRWRQRLSGSGFYQRMRRQFFPFPEPTSVLQEERTK